MDMRTKLYEQISNFENAVESFNNILICLNDGRIEICEEVSAIKEKLITSLKRDNIELPIEIESNHKREPKTYHVITEEEQKVAIVAMQKATQLLGMVSTYEELSDLTVIYDLKLDLEKEFKSIKKKIAVVLLASSLLPDEDKQRIKEDLADEIYFEEDEDAIAKDFKIGCNILHKYLGRKNNVVIPKGVRIISGWAFYKHQETLKTIQFPRSLERVSEHAFANFTELKEITIPAKVKYIDQLAFYGCKNLTRVTFENPDIVKIGHKSFDDTPWLNNALKSDGALIVGSRLVKVNPDLEEYIIPENITNICGGAFEGAKIKSLVVPEGVTYIGESAFNGCDLEYIKLPQTLSYVDEWAFANCESLENLALPEGVTHIGIHALYNLPNCIITILNGNEDEKTEIHDSSFGSKDWLFGDCLPNVKAIKAPYGSKAMRCAMLWNLPFIPLEGTPKTYTYIDGVFCCNGTKLHNYLGHEKIVRVPEGITSLDEDSFRNDYGGAEHVILPPSVTAIHGGAFSWCASLKTVEGAGVEYVGKYAFSNSGKLEKVCFPNLKTLSEAAFNRCPSLSEENLHIPENVVIEERGFSLYALMQKSMEEDE